MSCAAGGAGAGKVLRVSSRSVVRKSGVARERVRAAEKAREKVEDAIEVEIEPEFPITSAAQVRNVVDELDAFDGRFARTEVIAADVEVCACAGANYCFRAGAVGETGLFVACQLKSKLVDYRIRQCRGQRS